MGVTIPVPSALGAAVSLPVSFVGPFRVPILGIVGVGTVLAGVVRRVR
ncbi:MAG: hypothetical protein ABEJ82_07660 [Haloplanus sp.]